MLDWLLLTHSHAQVTKMQAQAVISKKLRKMSMRLLQIPGKCTKHSFAFLWPLSVHICFGGCVGFSWTASRSTPRGEKQLDSGYRESHSASYLGPHKPKICAHLFLQSILKIDQGLAKPFL